MEKKKVTRISGNKRKTCDLILEQVQKNSKERQALFLKAMEKREPDHPVDIFFKSMAGTVKNLSAERQVRAKMQISQIVWQMELEECASRESPFSSVQSYSCTRTPTPNFDDSAVMTDAQNPSSQTPYRCSSTPNFDNSAVMTSVQNPSSQTPTYSDNELSFLNNVSGTQFHLNQ